MHMQSSETSDPEHGALISFATEAPKRMSGNCFRQGRVAPRFKPPMTMQQQMIMNQLTNDCQINMIMKLCMKMRGTNCV